MKNLLMMAVVLLFGIGVSAQDTKSVEAVTKTKEKVEEVMDDVDEMTDPVKAEDVKTEVVKEKAKVEPAIQPVKGQKVANKVAKEEKVIIKESKEAEDEDEGDIR